MQLIMVLWIHCSNTTEREIFHGLGGHHSTSDVNREQIKIRVPATLKPPNHHCIVDAVVISLL